MLLAALLCPRSCVLNCRFAQEIATIFISTNSMGGHSCVLSALTWRMKSKERSGFCVKMEFRLRIEWLAHAPRRAKFPLYHIPGNLSREKLHKLLGYFFPNIVQHYHLQSVYRCAIILLSRGRGVRVEKVPTQYAHPPCKARKKSFKKLKFPLDKSHTMWYNTSVPSQGTKIKL